MLVAGRSGLFLWKKVKELFWSCISLFKYASFLVLLTWHFHIRSFFLLWSLSRDISIYGMSIFGRFVHIVIVSCFQIHFFGKRRNNQMAAVMLPVIPSFCTIYSKNCLFISANTNEIKFMRKEYYIARHDDKMCFPPNCKYHNILIRNIEELLQKLDALCSN